MRGCYSGSGASSRAVGPADPPATRPSPEVLPNPDLRWTPGIRQGWTCADGPDASSARIRKGRLVRVDRKRLPAGQTDAIDPNVWSGRALQEVSSIRQMRSCINVSDLCLERVVLRIIMDISAHSI